MRLRAAGHRAIALTLPGLGIGDDPSCCVLNDAVDRIVGEVRRLELDRVTLVAHSWGGYPGTAAARLLGHRVDKLVYYNGLVPSRGISMADDHPARVRRELILRLIDESPVGAIAPYPELVEQELMQGVAPALQRMVTNLLAPQPGRYFLDALDTDVAALGVPTAYLAGDDDRALPRPAAALAARLGVKPTSVPGTHLGMLTHPADLAEAIMTA